jgi:hypothetical protein
MWGPAPLVKIRTCEYSFVGDGSMVLRGKYHPAPVGGAPMKELKVGAVPPAVPDVASEPMFPGKNGSTG